MNSPFRSIEVELSDRSYTLLIGTKLIARPDWWAELTRRRIFIITDEDVGKLYAGELKKASADEEVHTYTIPSGEGSKSINEYASILDWMIAHDIDRNSVVLALGGGVVGDLAGFAAATILRGVDFIQIPTSLLAQVDSSVGGKTGINSPRGKNLIGAFYQPKKVVIDLSTLETLPEREMKAGYAEIVKYGLLGDEAFFEWLEQNGKRVLDKDTEALTHAIQTSCRMKAEIVRQDEFETTGLRALLNLGHTFAHALEAACRYDGRLLHGEAVGIGLVLAARLSQKLGYITIGECHRVERHLQAMSMMTEIREVAFPEPTSSAELLRLMRKDKKATAGSLNFVVLKRMGKAAIERAVPEDLILTLLEESM